MTQWTRSRRCRICAFARKEQDFTVRLDNRKEQCKWCEEKGYDSSHAMLKKRGKRS